MSLLFFVPVLLIVLLICADARGGSLIEAIDGGSKHYLRYVVLLALVVTFVGVMVAIPGR
jgi:hypothetical protein